MIEQIYIYLFVYNTASRVQYQKYTILSLRFYIVVYFTEINFLQLIRKEFYRCNYEQKNLFCFLPEQ